MKAVEKEIEQFLEDIENGKAPSFKKTITLKSYSFEVVEEEIKELIFYHMIKKERERLERGDEGILEGDTRHHGRAPQGAETRIDGPMFTIDDSEFMKEVNFSKWDDTQFVSLEYINNRLDMERKNLNVANYMIKIGEELNLPEEDLNPAQKYENIMEERVQILEKIGQLMENGQTDKARNTWEKLAKKVVEEEHRI